MIDRFTLISIAAAIATGALGGWAANGWRLGAEIARIEQRKTSQQLSATNAAIAEMVAHQKGMTDALDKFQRTQHANDEAADKLARVLLDLRSTTAGMRGDFAGLTERIDAASDAGVRAYARACTDVLNDLAERGRGMAERGAEVARQADRHAAESRQLYESWPRK